MPYYPILVELENQKVLVVGGGMVAQRKIDTLLRHGAEVLIVSRELSDLLEQYVEEGRVTLIDTEFNVNQLDDVFMVIAATDDAELNAVISAEAKKRGMLINAVDQPADCTFIVPSVIRQGDLLVAISTSGKSPALAKKIRKELETKFGKGYKEFLALMGIVRERVLEMGLPQKENSRIFHELVDSRLLEAVKEQDIDGVTSILNSILEQNISAEEVENYMKTG